MKTQFLYPLCLRCGSLSVRSSLFCRDCENDFLIPRMMTHTRHIEYGKNSYPIDFLIHWVPGESDSLSELVYLLKSSLSFSVWRFYVEKFIQFYSLFEKKKLKTALIPIPGSRPRKKPYHTWYFAQAWQLFDEADIVPCLVSQPKLTEQKELTLKERGQAKMSFLEDFTTILQEYERIILIDDIVTSGNTLRASLMAIKPHLRPGCLIEIKALLSRDKI